MSNYEDCSPQFDSNIVDHVRAVLDADVRERREAGEVEPKPDAAYLLGTVAVALYHSSVPHSVACFEELLSVYQSWLERFPSMREAYEARLRGVGPKGSVE